MVKVHHKYHLAQVHSTWEYVIFVAKEETLPKPEISLIRISTYLGKQSSEQEVNQSTVESADTQSLNYQKKTQVNI